MSQAVKKLLKHKWSCLVFLTSFGLNFQSLAQVPTDIPGVQGAYKLFPSGLTANDQLGTSVARIGDLNNDGNEDIVIGAPGDDASFQDQGAIYICLMKSDGTPDTCIKFDADHAVLTGDVARDDYFGWSVAGVGDMDENGFEDIIVGAPGHNLGNTDAGAAWILFLDTTGVVNITDKLKIADDSNGFPLGLLNRDDYFGSSVSALGDVNGDGYNDLLIGARNSLQGSIRPGAAYVLLMDQFGSAVIDIVEITNSSGNLPDTLDDRDEFGYSIAGTGDLNGDGINDMVVGAISDDDGASAAGAVWIIYLDSDGKVDTLRKLSIPLRSQIFDYYANYNFGSSITVTDINIDGQQDLYVGASGTSGSVFYGITLDSLERPLGVRMISTNHHSWDTNINVSTFGRSITTVVDLDSNGHAEVFVGQPSDNGNRGAVYVLTMDSLINEFSEGSISFMSMIGDLSGGFSATLIDNDAFGSSVTKLGDVNGDGIDDIAVGVPTDDDGGTNRGAVYILFLDTIGNVNSFLKLSSGNNNCPTLVNGDQFGASVYGPGDLDGDDIPDLYVGAPGDDDGVLNANKGAVWRFYLNSSGTAKTNNGRISPTDGNFGGTLTANCGFGISITGIGDLNGDGEQDIAVGAHLDDDGGASSDKGAVWILKMRNDDTVRLYQKISATQGSFSETFNSLARFGMSLGRIGDFNADTIPDLLVGAPYMDTTGAAYILYLDTTGMVDDFVKINYLSGNFPDSLQNDGAFGRSIISAGDMDGNSVEDLMIGQTDYNSFGKDRGAVWIAFLDSTGNVLRSQNISERHGFFYGNLYPDDKFGVSCTYYGFDSTFKTPQFYVGANGRDEGNTNRGAVFSIHPQNFSHPAPNFALLFRKPDGGHYLTDSKGRLYFEYRGEYYRDELVYNIYDDNHNVVASNSLTPGILYSYNLTGFGTDKVWEENRFFLDFGCNGLHLAAKYYLLEVINEKNEKLYLRFKKNKILCEGIGGDVILDPGGP